MGSVAAAIFVFCQGCSFESRSADSAGDLTPALNAHDWPSYVGGKTGIWISIKRQELLLIDNGRLVKCYRCSTAKAGAGSRRDSARTPLGWHRIGAKIGDALPIGAVLKDRQWSGRVWTAGQQTNDDLIVSRILWLEGLQDGHNRGGDVDTWNRYIYIHGTNRIEELGRPRSGGCIRLDPAEVIELYDRVDEGCCVLITRD